MFALFLQYSFRVDSKATKYIFAGNLRIAKVDSKGTRYYHKDHLGSSTVITQAGNESDALELYLPFGLNRTPEKAGSDTAYRFTDQEHDKETGLYNYDARLYDPMLGQFISADSLLPNLYDPQQLNRYAYCRNNPLIYNDPSGHVFVLAIPVAIGAVAIESAASAAITTAVVTSAVVIGSYIGDKLFSDRNELPSPGLKGNDYHPDTVRRRSKAMEDYLTDKYGENNIKPGGPGTGDEPENDHNYHPAPDNLPGFPDAEKAKSMTPIQGGTKKRERWVDSDGNIYEWDSQHGKVEKYNKSGKKHLGEYDHETGEQTKKPDKERKVER